MTDAAIGTQWREYPGGLSAVFGGDVPADFCDRPLGAQIASIAVRVSRACYPGMDLGFIGPEGINVSFTGNRLYYRFTPRTIHAIGEPQDPK